MKTTRTLRNTILVLTALVFLLGMASSYAYTKKDGRIQYNISEVTMVTVARNSPRVVYWTPGSKIKNDSFNLYLPESSHEGEWIQMFPANDPVVCITAHKDLMERMYNTVQDCDRREADDCAWDMQVFPAVYFILRNEADGRIYDYNFCYITDEDQVDELADKYAEYAATKQGYHIELKPYYVMVISKWSDSSDMKFWKDYAKGKVPTSMFMKQVLGFDVYADYKQEMHNQRNPWSTTREWRRDYRNRVMQAKFNELYEMIDAYSTNH